MPTDQSLLLWPAGSLGGIFQAWLVVQLEFGAMYLESSYSLIARAHQLFHRTNMLRELEAVPRQLTTPSKKAVCHMQQGCRNV